MDVYFTKNINSESIAHLYRQLNADLSGTTAIKVHFGEKGNTRYVHPKYIKPISDQIENAFVTDTNTLYRGMRLNSKDHLQIAKEHGFELLEKPIIIADQQVDIPTNTTHFKNVHIAKQIADADSMLVISHFKGHPLFGFGGALKNLGMGCGTRAGKLAMHSKIIPSIGPDCIACGECADNCAVNAITIDDKAVIKEEICIGCAKCIAVCPVGAVKIPWSGATSDEAQERCAEYALGAIRDKPCVYVTFINNLTKGCDCGPDSEIIGNDIGVIASCDPVAADQAAYDLIKRHHRSDIFKDATNVEGTHILDYAEQIGAGTRDYTLHEL
ncbi:MAG: DUF362 domain-containing protein [Nanoarchaeota archaeon]